ncbi:MAG: CAP domain-containing protein [Candidatus Colwellbacteria bacterium]|nr:CAP domain-containing protein [Candidatus Colwellbacteria bacterium]
MERMKIILKKYFIPHEGNEYKPHLLRWEVLLVLVSIVLGIELLFLGQVFIIKNTTWLADVLESVLIDQTNVERQEAGLYGLQVNELLQEAARMKAEDMAERGYFAHTTPDGKTPWYWLEEAGYVFAAAGENLAVNFVDSEDVTEAWMNSPKHKDNILGRGFTEIGIATAKGVYKGRETTFVVQFFGRPMVRSAAAGTTGIQRPSSAVPTEPAGEDATGNEVSDTSVAGAEVDEAHEELYIETQMSEAIPLAGRGTAVAQEQAGFWEEFRTHPRFISNLFLATLATIILLALLLKIFVAIRIQHPPLIVNGVLMLLIVASAIWFNQYLSLTNVAVV